MAAEHVFYGENSQGVGGDVQSATATAAAMVGMWAMGPDPVHLGGSMELDEQHEAVLKRLERIGSTIMNRAGSPGLLGDNPIGAVLGSPDKKRAAAQILGQAYITAICCMRHNREAVARVADTLVQHRELYGDEVVALLEQAQPVAPAIDVTDESIWPKV
jgi:ATP-dependent Zn protease